MRQKIELSNIFKANCPVLPELDIMMKKLFNHCFSLPSLMILLIMAGAVSCSCGGNSPGRKVGHVIVLGFDGLAGATLDSADMPCLKGLMEKGSWTTTKRSILPTSSAANWATMFMGAGPEVHGFIEWDSREPAFTPAELAPNGHVPTVFTLMRKTNPDAETACTYQWDGIAYVVDTMSISKVRQFPSEEKGIDEELSFVKRYIVSNKPELSAFVWDYPDHTGHSVGWYTPEYYSMLSKLDKVIRGVVEAVSEAGILDDTVIIVTSDHGGHNTWHGNPVDNDLFSPLVFYGKGVVQGRKLSTPVYQYDIAATIAYLLGLETPSSWRGVPTLEAFEFKGR